MIPDRPLPPKLAPDVKKVNLIAPTDLLARSEAIRRLIEKGLEAEAREKKPKPKG